MNELYYWIALRYVLGVGNVNYKNLINSFESPADIFQADPRSLEKVSGLNKKVIQSIVSFKPSQAIDQELDLINTKNIQIITLKDPCYPENLKNIYDPPPFLYVKGEIKLQDRNAIAVVGSRNASEYGIISTERISRLLALNGLTVISGMARGVDSRAHYGALAAKGRTIAVLGSGIDVIYPPENKRLYDAIVANGAVITEFPMGTKPHGYNFPSRNRIISGLSLGVLVVEASLRSGSLITAQVALEQGREVFAVPGSVHSHKSKGTHRLLKEGAKLVESAQDILEELNLKTPSVKTGETLSGQKHTLSSDAQMVYHLLQNDAFYIDAVILQTGLSSGQVATILLELELQGLVKQLPGKRFTRA